MRSKILGYIVVCPDGVYKSCIDPGQDQPTLWFGGSATLFSSRKIAVQILERTKIFAQANNYKWPWLEKSYAVEVRAQA